jgi:2-polyprenyl-3-methyl-5-hydroxy-6-metoxy-1,4-benzoquinol methylase
MLDYLNGFYKPQGGIEIEDLNGWHYILCECKNCQLIFQKEILNDELMEKLYEQWLDPQQSLMNTSNHDPRHYFNLAEEIIQVIKYFELKPSELNFIDFGMGWGEWCKMAKALGCNVYGVELSTSRNAYAKQHAIRTLLWEEIPNHQFHFINTEQVFEHIPDPLNTLQHLKRSLAPNGLIKISVPDGADAQRVIKLKAWNAPKGTKDSMNIVAPLEHINCFNYRSLKTMAGLVKLTPCTELAYSKYPNTLIDLIKNQYRKYYINLFRRNKGTYLFLKNENNK